MLRLHSPTLLAPLSAPSPSSAASHKSATLKRVSTADLAEAHSSPATHPRAFGYSAGGRSECSDLLRALSRWRLMRFASFPDANHAHARNLLQLLHSEPWIKASKVAVPILLTPIRGKDELCPQWSAARAARRAAKGEYKQVGSAKTNHFSVYKPGLQETCFEEASEMHVDFLKRIVA